MSDELLGILRMPKRVAISGELSSAQHFAACEWAAGEIERLKADNSTLRRLLSEVCEAAEDMRPRGTLEPPRLSASLMVRIEDARAFLSGEQPAEVKAPRNLLAGSPVTVQFISDGISRSAHGGQPKAENVICDGCNVRDPWEHRCHGKEAVVREEQTYKPCECPRCKELVEFQRQQRQRAEAEGDEAG